METYELTCILPGEVTSQKKNSFIQKLEKTLNEVKGEILNTQEWGKIDLQYPIKKNNVGFFLHFTLKLEKSLLKKLNEKLRIDDDIIRYLLVKSERK